MLYGILDDGGTEPLRQVPFTHVTRGSYEENQEENHLPTHCKNSVEG